jgi:Uncharacterized protein conserved in bacteria
VQIISDKFGMVKIDDNSIIDFPGGIPGFSNLTKFAIVKCLQTEPIQWFQSVEDGHITLPVINPFLIKPDYNIEINDDDLELLQTHNEEDLIVLNVMVLPNDLKEMTINLMAPILINIKKMVGCQVLMDHREVPLRFNAYVPLMEYYKNNKEGVDDNAGTDQED